MPSLPTPILRALESVAERSGRTVVIAGPALSGKSRLLQEIRESVGAKGARIIDLRGSYRDRSTPYGALDGLRGPPESSPDSGDTPMGALLPAGEGEPDLAVAPIAPIAYNPERLPRRRRGRTGAPRTSFLGQPVRGRSANEGDPDGFWHELEPEFRGERAHPVAIIIDDAVLFDADSREFVVSLSRRARLRPLLIAIALDTSAAGASLWEERLFGRGDVDWVRTTAVATDPREVRRLKELFESLPPASRRMVGYIALLGGNVSEVVLTRVSRLNFTQLADALAPPTSVGLLRLQEAKLTIPHRGWISLIADLITEEERKKLHLEIAEALSALSPEPVLSRRIEVAQHYLAAGPGPMAMAALLEAAEISVQLLSFDTAADLLSDAVGCLAAIPPVDRKAVEPELRLLYARALFSAGRPAEAELQVREGVDGAITAEVPAAELSELVEPLLLSMRVVGARPSLTTTLVELAERCHEARLTELEVLFEVLVAEFHRERNQPDRSRSDAHRAAVLARHLSERHLQALGLLTMGFSRIDGSREDQELAGRFLRAARVLLGQTRRWELDYLAGDYEARLLERRGDLVQARASRERSLAGLQRERLLSIELFHVIGIAEATLDLHGTKGWEARLARAATIVETIHLLPPSPALLRFWLVDGRARALAGAVDEARDRWAALVDLPPADSLPRVRMEAIVRLALLEFASGATEEGRRLVAELDAPEMAAVLPADWAPWVRELESVAAGSKHGGAPLPPNAQAPDAAESTGKSPGAMP